MACALGHTRRAYECPACGEDATPGQTATLEHWRWYRGRTSSKRIKALIDERVAGWERCGCARECGDDGDVDGPGVCKGLPAPKREPLVEVVLVDRRTEKPPCGFCKGGPVGNAASWIDGEPRPPAPCPRCGETAAA